MSAKRGWLTGRSSSPPTARPCPVPPQSAAALWRLSPAAPAATRAAGRRLVKMQYGPHNIKTIIIFNYYFLQTKAEKTSKLIHIILQSN